MKRRDEVAVGILITVSTIVLVLGTIWMVQGGLKSGYPLHTRFSWGQNLKQGQPVLLAGVTVGTIGDVQLERNGYLDVMLRINDEYTIPKGSTATVKPIGIFGDVAVALTPPMPVPAASYEAGDTVPPGPTPPGIDAIMGRVDSIGQSASVLLKAIETQLVAAGTLTELHKTVASTAALTAQLQRVIADQNKNLTETGTAFRQTAERFGKLADSAQIAQTLANAKQVTENGARLVANLDSTNTRVQRLLAQAETGNGTIGKLLSDSLLYGDFRRLIFTTDSLMADFKANPRKYINLSVFGGR
jgi:phospholipid/cholesterol/gamma-HCH transport system substrate-binding protein